MFENSSLFSLEMSKHEKQTNNMSEVADLHGVFVPSASSVWHSVYPTLCQQLNNITFPTTADELNRVKNWFYKITHFLNVVGAIDGTLIPIQGMSGDDESNFISRKGFTSINLQRVVHADLGYLCTKTI